MILVLNAGSSNVKYGIYDPSNLALITKGQVDNIQQVFSWLTANQHNYRITAVGHRIVHGGATFFEPVVISSKIIKQLQDLIPLAPLHQPHNIAPIEFVTKQYPNLKQIACFDTAFHCGQDSLAKLFAIPNELTAAGVIRYGFHGLSYEYITSIVEAKLGAVGRKKIIVAHLGNGASMCAIENGRSVATSMGFSALDGLMMGTRCGNIDPGVLLYLLQEKQYNPEQLSDLLYHRSGLLGVSNLSNDMRSLLADNSNSAQNAIELFCYKAAMEFGSLMVALQGCDALIFTGGIGEHAVAIREKICKWLTWLGLAIDPVANKQNNAVISVADSKMLAAVLATDEEFIIAKHTQRLC